MIIFSWRDIVEVLFFSFTFFHISRWLYRDKTKPLLRYFYGFLTLLLCAYLLELSTISYCLFLFSPALVMLFIIFHQESLQRNFVALKTVPSSKQSDVWLDTLMRTCLVAINTNKTVQFIIEYSDDITPFIHAAYPIHAQTNEDLLCFIIEHPAIDPNKMIWVSNTGYIKGINVFWKNSAPNQDETALFYTEKTDVLILSVYPKTNSVTLKYGGKIYSDITVHHAAQVLQKSKMNNQAKQKGERHEPYQTTNQPRHPSA